MWTQHSHSFTKCGHYLHKNIQGSQRKDDSQKDGCSKADGKYSTGHSAGGSKKRDEGPGDDVIDATDILWEAVHNPPLGGGLEKWHGRVHDVDQHSLVELTRGNSWSQRHGYGRKEDKHSLWHAQATVNAKKEVTLLVWCYIGRAPPCKPDAWPNRSTFANQYEKNDAHREEQRERPGVIPEHWKFHLQTTRQ